MALKRNLTAPGNRILMADTVSSATLVVSPADESGGDASAALSDLLKRVIAQAEERGV